ncbi:MAG: DUF1501 domain-containing protein, partial [Planctomycetes bacterium]|nr:DUF1501 domain-containing protein [Planctomycetota bacterium]
LAQDSPAPKRKGGDHRILVAVQIAGGNDGLNTVVPYEMDGYYKARPRLAIAKKDVLKLENGIGLHPAATGFKELFDAGRCAIVQGVGYPNPNRSHFTSTDIWHTADPELRMHDGWVGRYFDSCCKGDDPSPEPIQGIAMTQETPLAMQGEKFTPLSFENPDSLSWRAGSRDAAAADTFRKLNNIDGDFPNEPHALAQYLQRAALKAQVGADEIRSAAGGATAGGARRGFARGGGGQLAQKLQLVTRLIAADMPTRVYYVTMGGFDTHTGQEGRHQRLMQELTTGISQFIEQLDDQKLLDRVLVMSFSEFGRRVQENASGGTDHGEAAPMFLFGSHVKPGLHEPHPDLSKLHRGDLEFGCDFRRVYATVLRDWLNAKPEVVLGRGFQPLKVLKV